MNPNREELLFQLALMKPAGERASRLLRTAKRRTDAPFAF